MSTTTKKDCYIITATNKEEICKVISTLKINKSCEPNSIPTKILHLVQDQISKHLPTICNLSFSTGIFPFIKRILNLKCLPHKKVSRDLTEKKQDLTEISIILMVLTEIYVRFYLSKILSQST